MRLRERLTTHRAASEKALYGPPNDRTVPLILTALAALSRDWLQDKRE